jgi:hypothetical protein
VVKHQILAEEFLIKHAEPWIHKEDGSIVKEVRHATIFFTVGMSNE